MPTVFTDLIVGLIVPAEVKYDQAQARSCRIAEGGEVSAEGSCPKRLLPLQTHVAEVQSRVQKCREHSAICTPK